MCTRRDPGALPAGLEVVSAEHTDRQSTFLVRGSEPVRDPGLSVANLDLEDLVLAYMGGAKQAALEAAR